MFKSQGGFKNFWYYNKLKIFATVIVLLFVGFAFSQCSGKVETDFSLLHVSNDRETDGNMLMESLKNQVQFDAENESPNLEFIHVFVPNDPRDIMETGALEKIQVELVSGKSTLFILDEETVYSYKDDDFFYDLTDVADKLSIPDDKRYFGANGEVLAILADGNSYLEENGVPASGECLAIRNHSSDEADKYSNAFSVLNCILTKGM